MENRKCIYYMYKKVQRFCMNGGLCVLTYDCFYSSHLGFQQLLLVTSYGIRLINEVFIERKYLMAFFPIDFRHKPNSASFPLEIRRVKALFCRIAILWTHHFKFEGVRLVIRSGFRLLYWKAQGKSTRLSESGWLRAVKASAC